MADNQKTVSITPDQELNSLLDDSEIDKKQIEEQIDQHFANPNSIKTKSSKQNIWIKPITKKRLILKLIPFMLLCLIAVGLFIACLVLPSVLNNLNDTSRLSLYLLGPILLVCFSPFCFYLFDRPYCQYNLKHNEKMKNILSKVFVKSVSRNGCFRLKEIYLSNPNQSAWLMNERVIIYGFYKWDPEQYAQTIKYYRENNI